MRTLLVVAIAIFSILAFTPQTSAQTLKPGDKMPAMDIEHFFKGKKLTKFDPNKIYVLEFWATWCGPCKRAMPHLRSLAKSYKDKVTVVALSDESVEKVGDFLDQTSMFGEETWSQVMDFAVATDSDGSVKKDIFSAAGRRGIPSSFLIAKNKLQWVGHPMELDEPLRLCVAGEWSLDKAKELEEERESVREMMMGLQSLVRDAVQGGDWKEVLKTLDKASKKYPTNVDVLGASWQIRLLFAGDYEGAYKVGEKLVQMNWDDAQVLNEVAWTVVDDERVETRNLEFAMRVAKRANELTESKNGPILDTLARVYYEKGELGTAIKWQKRAVEYAEGEMRGELEGTLEKYQKEAKTEKF